MFSRFEYLFNFDNRFEIHDDIEVLKRMGMAFGLERKVCNDSNIELAKTMVPKALEPYVTGEIVTQVIRHVAKRKYLILPYTTKIRIFEN